MTNDERGFVVGEGLLNGILQYMVTRPYTEVFQLIEAIRSLQPMEAPPAAGVNPSPPQSE